METTRSPSAVEQQLLITSFLEIAVGQSADTAIQFLQATCWKLEEAIQLFYVGNEGGGLLPPPPSSSALPPPAAAHLGESLIGGRPFSESPLPEIGEDGVRAPLPVKRETLYGEASFARLPASSVVAFRNFEEESKQPAVWESDQSSSATETGSRDNLASLYRPPYALMFNGPFEKAKVEASLQNKWLLINLQSTEEFSSHMLNRDTWSNEAVAQTIRTNFIFWQVFHDTSEGQKVCTYYKLDSIPAILVIDPITGQKMHARSGMVQPERLLEDLLQFMERGPKEHHVTPHKRPREAIEKSALTIPDKTFEEQDEEILLALAASMEAAKETMRSHATDDEPKPVKDDETSSNGMLSYPPLPEEPKTSRELLCRVGIRLPDGRRVQRNFLRTDPIKFLWSFCSSLVEEGGKRPFHFTQAIPGVSKNLDYESNLTFEEAALSNSMISMKLD